MAEALGDDELAVQCRRTAERLGSLRGTLEPHGSKQAAAMLALPGLRDSKEMFASVLGANGHAGVSTFYGYYMLEAMSLAGEKQRAQGEDRREEDAALSFSAFFSHPISSFSAVFSIISYYVRSCHS